MHYFSQVCKLWKNYDFISIFLRSSFSYLQIIIRNFDKFFIRCCRNNILHKFYVLKNWVYIAHLCIITDINPFLIVPVYFLKSPRFLVSKGQYEKALKVLYRIAKKNSKCKDFYKYILSNIIYKDINENEYFNNSNENKVSYQAKNIAQVLNSNNHNKDMNFNDDSILDKNTNYQKTNMNIKKTKSLKALEAKAIVILT